MTDIQPDTSFVSYLIFLPRLLIIVNCLFQLFKTPLLYLTFKTIIRKQQPILYSY